MIFSRMLGEISAAGPGAALLRRRSPPAQDHAKVLRDNSGKTTPELSHDLGVPPSDLDGRGGSHPATVTMLESGQCRIIGQIPTLPGLWVGSMIFSRMLGEISAGGGGPDTHSGDECDPHMGEESPKPVKVIDCEKAAKRNCTRT